MEEEGSSWIRRAKFSHTVYHRFDSSTSRLTYIPITPLPHRISGLKSKPEPITTNLGVGPNFVQVRSLSNNKHRAVSPIQEVKLPETFKQARSTQIRFSTPNPRGKHQEKPNFVHRDSLESPKPSSNTKAKSRKDSTWAKYFDHGGGRVSSVENADENTVDLSKLFFGFRFAHGAHSKLYRGTYMDKAVAVKVIRFPVLDDDENGALRSRLEKQFTREVSLLSRLRHSNVVKFIGACNKPEVNCVITEFLPKGSLRSFLHKLDDKILPLPNLISMALDIARGMEYIHSQQVIHRDLKPENILLTQDFRLKVADFGIACEESCRDLLADDPGTYRWMAPEMIKRKQYGRRVDVYSFGLILWEFVAGKIPYEDMTPVQAAFAVVNKDLRPCFPADCPPAMKALIEQCWCSKPDKRPEFWQIVKVLEEFESSFARDGTLTLLQNQTFHDQRKGLIHWIHKLGPIHQTNTLVAKPKFS